ncbi:alpha/beta fold hydrolase [Qaidamihabitans albus]|uniref:alpha/beta fold hydrolase n=1 Tax=Qaidamihabitans albus TaxID=2795733 RepID=UPI001F412020|nr:alpha/beta hydrolase [Qaidamihabitans albus]
MVDREPTGLTRRGLLKRASAVTSAAAAAALVPRTAVAEPGERRHGTPVPEPIPPQVPVGEGTVDVPGGHLWYWDTGGEGPAVVLVHAASGSAESWPYQQPVLARAGYRVIAYSRRGHYGSSAFADADAPVGADDLHALVERLELDTFHLVSAALGGYYATDYALLHPARVRSFTVVSSFMAIRDPEYLALTGGLRPPEFNALPTYFKELSPSYRAANPDGLRQWRAIADRARLTGSAYRHVVANEITWDRLATLRPRTLLVTGDSDLYLPPPVMRLIARHIDGCGTVVFPEVGHSANWETPTPFNRVLLRFLAGARIRSDAR